MITSWDRKALVAMTQALVRIDSQTPPSATGATIEAVQAFLAGVPGLTFRHYVSEAPVENLVIELDGGTPGPRTILNGHLDTYPIGDVSSWTHEPLGGALENGRIHGRGAADMKGGVAVLVAALARFAQRGPFPGSIVLALAGDEERMGELGTQWLIDHADEIHGDAVLVADVGGASTIRLGEKGMLWLDIHAEGRQAHSAHVHAGTNAADQLIDALTALRAVEDLIPTPPDDAVQVMQAAGRISGENQEVRDTMGRVTANVGLVSAGTSSNLIPATAFAGVDIRIPLGLTTAQVEEAVARQLDHREAISWTVVRRYEPSWTSSSSDLAKACLKGASRAIGHEAWFDNRIGGSDARLWRRAGYPCVVIGLTPHNLGGPDESCEVDELETLLDVYLDILEEIHIG
ncbi:M20 family peptidase [Pseudaminobacter arsenicus]|uniref:M20 family peptidase n=1 Tax=Borborobacter arsenicus TaxID=1851146 RepID=A0A432VB71_9HYPH|nr:M20/M25/M40 family metallo-hydrolase [Pseudaminobacter arsenicus]RUM99421.1 M20 family peptidase [Pseudaminobacter arsenicus]